MRIAIIGAGNIGGNAARFSAAAGHEVTLSFSRDPLGLKTLADEIGGTSDTPEGAARGAHIVVLSVPWGLVDEALAAAGGPSVLNGSIIVDTTNQFERRDGALAVLDLGESSAARHNASKVPGARWVKAFNTLTSGFQASAAKRTATRPRRIRWVPTPGRPRSCGR